jgi:glycosyltransferase involved in cell wall biosynthesis
VTKNKLGNLENPKVQVLLATLNGAKYIEEQIKSILDQTYKNIIILAHDDGSTDDTKKILFELSVKHPDKIYVLDDGVIKGSAKDNFAHLLLHSTSEYIMFSDQDDFWLPTKVEKTLEKCVDLEKTHIPETPICVFGDLIVVDEDLRQIHPSLWQMQATNPLTCRKMKSLAQRNCVTGCTMLLNRAAVRITLPIPRNAIMHDWWIALVMVKVGGVLAWIPEPLILYRQHASNQVGAKKIGWNHYLSKIKKPISIFYGIENKFKMSKDLGAAASRLSFYFDSLCEQIRILLSR